MYIKLTLLIESLLVIIPDRTYRLAIRATNQSQ